MSILRYIRIFLLVPVFGTLASATPDCLVEPEKQASREEPGVIYVPVKAPHKVAPKPLAEKSPIAKEAAAIREAIDLLKVKEMLQDMRDRNEAKEKKQADEKKKKSKSFVAAFRDKAEEAALDVVYTGARWTAALIALNIIASSGWIVEGAGKLVFYGAENVLNVGDKFLTVVLNTGSRRPTAIGWLCYLVEHVVHRPAKYLLRPVF